jgi:hypothetical protein
VHVRKADGECSYCSNNIKSGSTKSEWSAPASLPSAKYLLDVISYLIKQTRINLIQASSETSILISKSKLHRILWRWYLQKCQQLRVNHESMSRIISVISLFIGQWKNITSSIFQNGDYKYKTFPVVEKIK